MASNLPPVFLDEQRVSLQGDPRPAVAKILEAVGKSPEEVEVVRVRAQGANHAHPLRLWDVIDRTREDGSGIHLKSVPRPSAGVPLHERSQLRTKAPTFGGDWDDGLPEWGMGRFAPAGSQGTPGNVAGAKRYQEEMEDEGRGYGGSPFKETGNIHKGPTGIGKAEVDEVRRKSEGR